MTDQPPKRTSAPNNSREAKLSLDQFHRGEFELYQFTGPGHRAGMDAMLLGASLPKGASGTVADLGAASGAAGIAAISNHSELHALLIEQRQDLCDLVKKSLQLEVNAQIRNRVTVLCADVTLSGEKRVEAGLVENSVDYVIANPPYNPPNLRASPAIEKATAHVMGEGGLDAWMRTASAILKPSGHIGLIYRTERLGEIIACFQGRFGDLRVLPVFSRQGESAKRIIVRARKGSKAPLSILPGIVMHDSNGNSTKAAKAVINGQALLDFGD